MQIFTPYPSPIECAEALWKDQKRFNKQILECKQILDAIDGKKAWSNHPCTLMYKEHREWLNKYMLCLKYFKNMIKGEVLISLPLSYSEEADSIRPSFLTDEFCDQHKRRLYAKAPSLYPQFEKYGTSEINWYFVNGELLKYKDGKRIKE